MLVGRHRIGLVGLRRILGDAEASGAAEMDALVEHVLERLAEGNYVPDTRRDDYRLAIRREILARRGEDVRELLPSVEIVLRLGSDRARDEMIDAIEGVLERHDMRPVFTAEEPPEDGPEILADGELLVKKPASRRVVEQAVRRRISGW
jgi:hypothetical protein